MWKLDWLENRENPQDLAKKNQEISDWLINFWNNKEKDNDFLEKTRWWDIVKVITDDVEKKSKGLNDPVSKAKVEDLLKNVKWYSEIWKLNEKQAREISDIYKTINSIERTEHAENAKQWEDFKKSMDSKNQEETKKLIEACEKLESLLKNHHEEAQEKIKKDGERWREARKKAEESSKLEIASFEEDLNIPTPEK